MNLFSKIATILLILPAPTPALILPLPASRPSTIPHTHDAAHWDFDLYNNKRCAGPASKATGWGSSGCRTDVPVGGARGYSLKDLDAGCSVTLYKDNTCTTKQKVAAIGHDNVRGCYAIGGRKKYVRSFEVKCY